MRVTIEERQRMRAARALMVIWRSRSIGLESRNCEREASAAADTVPVACKRRSLRVLCGVAKGLREFDAGRAVGYGGEGVGRTFPESMCAIMMRLRRRCMRSDDEAGTAEE